jgi:hypothetical protein
MAQSVQTLPSPAELNEDQLASRANAVPQVNGSASYTVGVSITNVRGKVQIGGFTTGAVGRFDFVGLYKGSFPSDPNSNYVTYQYVTNGLPLETGETYGPGWVAAYVSFDYAQGKYVYQATVGPTT